jgi:hypothetical protein
MRRSSMRKSFTMFILVAVFLLSSSVFLPGMEQHGNADQDHSRLAPRDGSCLFNTKGEGSGPEAVQTKSRHRIEGAQSAQNKNQDGDGERDQNRDRVRSGENEPSQNGELDQDRDRIMGEDKEPSQDGEPDQDRDRLRLKDGSGQD